MRIGSCDSKKVIGELGSIHCDGTCWLAPVANIVRGWNSRKLSMALLQCVPERNHAESDERSPAVEVGKRPSAEETGTAERGFEGSG